MKKIHIVSVLIILFLVSIVGTAYAASAKIIMKSSVNECKKEEEVTFEVKLSNIDNEKGVIALGGTIVYNKAELEFKGISNAENWSTSYNSDNGKFVADRSDRTKESETVFNITFKAIAEEKNNVNVTLSDLEASGGDGAIKISDASASVNIKATEQKTENTAKPENTTKPENTAKPATNTNTAKKENENTNTNKNTDTKVGNTSSLDKNKNIENKASGIIPKAGSSIITPIIIVLIFLGIVVSLSIYLKFSKLDK